MSSIPLAALAVQTQQPPNILDQYSKVQQLKSLGLQQQNEQQVNQMQALQLKDQQTLRTLAPQHVTKDANGNVTGFDTDGFLQDAAGQGVNPKTLSDMRLQYADTVQKTAAASEAVRTNEQAKNKAMYETLESVRGVQDPAGRMAALQSALPSLQKQGIDTSKIPVNQPITDDALNQFEAGLGMHAQALADAKTKAETNEAQQKASQSQADAALANIKVNLSKNSKPGDFDAQIDQMMDPKGPNAQMGQITKASVNASLARGDFDSATKTVQDAYNQVADINKETNPQVLQARAQQAADTAKIVEPLRLQLQQQFGNDKDARDKIETTVLKPFQDKMSDVSAAQSAIAQAADNPVAARAAVFKMIGVAQPSGSHRVLPAEITAFRYPGGIEAQTVERWNNFLKGEPWTPDIAKAATAFVQAQGGIAQDNLNRGIDNTNKLYNTKVGEGLKQGGGKSAPQEAVPPAGATHKVLNRADGRQHWTDAQNSKDMGVAE